MASFWRAATSAASSIVQQAAGVIEEGVLSVESRINGPESSSSARDNEDDEALSARDGDVGLDERAPNGGGDSGALDNEYDPDNDALIAASREIQRLKGLLRNERMSAEERTASLQRKLARAVSLSEDLEQNNAALQSKVGALMMDLADRATEMPSVGTTSGDEAANGLVTEQLSLAASQVAELRSTVADFEARLRAQAAEFEMQVATLQAEAESARTHHNVEAAKIAAAAAEQKRDADTHVAALVEQVRVWRTLLCVNMAPHTDQQLHHHPRTIAA